MTTPLQTLETCLTQQLELARRFLAALQEESRLLEDPGLADQLAGSTAAKLACVQQFEALDSTRNRALAQLGHTPDNDGLRQALAQHPALAGLLDELQDAAAQARDLNEQNGTVIHTYLRHAQQTLADLRQLTGQATEPLYNASGRPKASLPAGRTHIKAG